MKITLQIKYFKSKKSRNRTKPSLMLKELEKEKIIYNRLSGSLSTNFSVFFSLQAFHLCTIKLITIQICADFRVFKFSNFGNNLNFLASTFYDFDKVIL